MAEIIPTLTGSSLCTLAIFIPFIYLGGVTGAFFRVLALSMALMLSTSLLLCIVVVPWLGVAPTQHTGGDRLRRILDRGLALIMRRWWYALALAAVFILAVVPLRSTLGSGFLPEMDEGSLILDYVAPPGSSVEETDRMLRQVERLFAEVPEIAAWSRRTGDQLGFFITEPNNGDYTLRLRNGKRRSADAVADDLRERLAVNAPAIEVEFGQLVEDVIGDLTTNPEPVEVRGFGEDRPLARLTAQRAAALMEGVRGVVDGRSGGVGSGPNLMIAPIRRGARLGLDAGGLARAAGAQVAAIETGHVPPRPRAGPI